MGENRVFSYDSRYWGFIPKENVIGRPMFIYWSFETPANQYLEREVSQRISFLAHVGLHFFDETRWRRTLRIVKCAFFAPAAGCWFWDLFFWRGSAWFGPAPIDCGPGSSTPPAWRWEDRWMSLLSACVFFPNRVSNWRTSLSTTIPHSARSRCCRPRKSPPWYASA